MGRYRPGTLGDVPERMLLREARRRREAQRQSGSRSYNTTEKVRQLAAAVRIATVERVGLVKPDGTTVTIDADGTIHAVGGGGGDIEEVVARLVDEAIAGMEFRIDEDGHLVCGYEADGGDVAGMIREAVAERISEMSFRIDGDGNLVWEDGS